MKKILIIDDSPTEIFKLKDLLKDSDYDIVVAEDGESGLKLATSEKPDVILMDVVMPEMNGYQATRQIAKDASTSHIPVIIVTTKDQETDKIWGMRQGAKEYLTKPVSKQDLLDAINRVIL